MIFFHPAKVLIGIIPGMIGQVIPKIDQCLRSRGSINGQEERKRGKGRPTSLSALGNPFNEDVSVVEELSDDKVTSGINLLLKMLDIIFKAGAIGVSFGVSC